MTVGGKLVKLESEEKAALISRLVDELPVLRTKLGVSQDELSGLIGVSRQTYSSIETKRRKMTWGIFLSLILIFDNADQTRSFIRNAKLFPEKIFSLQNDSNISSHISSFFNDGGIRDQLDDHAIHAIETVIMVEYARCNNLPSDMVIKAFEGTHRPMASQNDVKATIALKGIKDKS